MMHYIQTNINDTTYTVYFCYLVMTVSKNSPRHLALFGSDIHVHISHFLHVMMSDMYL